MKAELFYNQKPKSEKESLGYPNQISSFGSTLRMDCFINAT